MKKELKQWPEFNRKSQRQAKMPGLAEDLNASLKLWEISHLLDMLINNAGINGIEFNGNTPIMHSALETGIDKFKEVYEVNDPVLSM